MRPTNEDDFEDYKITTDTEDDDTTTWLMLKIAQVLYGVTIEENIHEVTE